MKCFGCSMALMILLCWTAAFSQKKATLEQTINFLEERQLYDSLINILEHSIHFVDVNRQKKSAHLEKLVNAYINKGDYINASTSCVKLIEWLEESQSLPQLSKAYAQKATAEYFLMNLEEAIHFTERSQQVKQQLGDTTGIIKDFIRLGILFQEMHDNEQALLHYRNAASLPTDSYDLQSNIYTSFSVAFSALGRHDSSVYYIKKSIEANKKETEPNQEAIINSFFNLAATYRDLKDYRMAIQYLDSTRQYEWNALPFKLVEKILAAYYDSYFQLNDLKNGNLYLKNYITYHDQVYQEKMNTEIKNFKVLYANEKRLREQQQQMKINELTLQKWVLSLLVTVLGLFMVGGTYSYRSNRRKIKAERDKVKIEQRLLRTQMNPHFILNTLAGIQMQVEDDQKAKASDYLSRFGRLMQITLENSRENFIPIESEIKALENYLELQLMRFEDEFEYKILSEGLEEEINIQIPPMIIQPFVENAIHHGIRGIGRKGFILIDIKLSGEAIICTVDDNGKGLKNSHPRFRHKKSLSTLIVRERLTILSAELKKNASLKIIDKTEAGEEGVKVIITIPYLTSC